MFGIRFVLSAVIGVVALALTAPPAAAQQALASVSVKGNQTQAFCLGTEGSLTACTDASNLFTRTYHNGRNVYVFSTDSVTCLDGAGGQGQRVRLAVCNGGPAQDWYHVDHKRIQNNANSLCLDISGNRVATGTPVILWGCSGAENQIFTLQTVTKQQVSGLRELTAQDIRAAILNTRQQLTADYVIAAGGYNLIGNATGNLSSNTIDILKPAQVIAAGGANLQNPSEVIAAGGYNLQNPSEVIAAGGANLIGQAGSNAIAAGGGNVIAAGGYNLQSVGGEAPAPVATVARPHLLPGGERFTCALDGNGTAYCWGRNDWGQLGDGSANPSTTPVKVQGGLKFAMVSTGYSHSCGLTEDGTAYCWGRGNSGQMGDGTQNHRREPTSMATDLKFRSISAGSNHTCGVAEDGTAYCWGWNEHGVLGDGTNTTFRSAPWPVKTDLKFTSITAGAYHSCGVTTSNQAYCWGPNASGWLGDGTRTDSYVPVAVAGNLSFQSVEVGAWFMCGLTTAGQAYCWGDNQNGRLGDGTHFSRTTPTPVAGGLTFVSLTAALDHACGLTASGQAYCWGAPGFGHLGSGDTNSAHPTPTRVSGGFTFRSLNTSEYHTCGVTTDGTGYCWGANWEYALGDGTETNRFTPVRVIGWTP